MVLKDLRVVCTNCGRDIVGAGNERSCAIRDRCIPSINKRIGALPKDLLRGLLADNPRVFATDSATLCIVCHSSNHGLCHHCDLDRLLEVDGNVS